MHGNPACRPTKQTFSKRHLWALVCFVASKFSTCICTAECKYVQMYVGVLLSDLMMDTANKLSYATSIQLTKVNIIHFPPYEDICLFDDVCWQVFVYIYCMFKKFWSVKNINNVIEQIINFLHKLLAFISWALFFWIKVLNLEIFSASCKKYVNNPSVALKFNNP